MKNHFIVLISIIIFASSCAMKNSIISDHQLVEDDATISYSTNGEGEVVLFVHAGGLDKEMWQNQMNYFGKKSKAISYDVRGHGKSVNGSNTTAEYEDINAILTAEKIEGKISLVGCSLGAIIALDYAIANPNKVHKLVLVSPGLIGFQEKNEEFLAQMNSYVQAIQSGNKEAMLASLKKLNAIGKEDRKLSESINQYIDKNLTSFIESNNHLRIPKFKEFNPLSRIGDLDVDCLILYGQLDFEYIKANAKRLEEGMKSAQLQPIANAAHLINLEQEKQFNRTLSRFLWID